VAKKASFILILRLFYAVCFIIMIFLLISVTNQTIRVIRSAHIFLF